MRDYQEFEIKAVILKIRFGSRHSIVETKKNKDIDSLQCTLPIITKWKQKQILSLENIESGLQ
jgi:hypothetical protein